MRGILIVKINIKKYDNIYQINSKNLLRSILGSV
jgi:hypothetical protein